MILPRHAGENQYNLSYKPTLQLTNHTEQTKIAEKKKKKPDS